MYNDLTILFIRLFWEIFLVSLLYYLLAQLCSSKLLIVFSGDVARDDPYEVEVTIPIENYDPVQFTLTKMCGKCSLAFIQLHLYVCQL